MSLSEYDDIDSYHDEDKWEMMETGVHDPQPPARAETTLAPPSRQASPTPTQCDQARLVWRLPDHD